MNIPEFENITCEMMGKIALVSMNRPDVMNACTSNMRKELLQAIELANASEAVTAIVLTGTGRGFCVGQDLAEGIPAGEPTRLLLEDEYKPLVLAINDSPKLVFAAVNGPAAGVGAALALACDLVVMADNAYMYQAFIAIGLIPDGGGCWQMVQQLGYRKALELVVDGKKVSAQDCFTLGLTNRVVAADDLLSSTIDWAASLAEKAPLALTASKRALKQAQSMSLAETLSFEANLQSEMTSTEDAQEAAKAFLEKRKPVFKGR